MKKKMAKDRVLAIILLIIAAFFIWQTTGIEPRATEGDPGARAFPYLGSAVLIVCALILLIKPGPDSQRMNLNKDEKKRFWSMVAIYFGTVLGTWALGLMYTLPITLFIVSYLFSKSSRPDMPTKKRIITTLIYTAIVMVVIYLVYVVLLDVSIKNGVLIDLIF